MHVGGGPPEPAISHCGRAHEENQGRGPPHHAVHSHTQRSAPRHVRGCCCRSAGRSSQCRVQTTRLCRRMRGAKSRVQRPGDLMCVGCSSVPNARKAHELTPQHTPLNSRRRLLLPLGYGGPAFCLLLRRGAHAAPSRPGAKQGRFAGDLQVAATAPAARREILWARRIFWGAPPGGSRPAAPRKGTAAASASCSLHRAACAGMLQTGRIWRSAPGMAAPSRRPAVPPPQPPRPALVCCCAYFFRCCCCCAARAR